MSGAASTRVLVIEDDPIDLLAVERSLLTERDEEQFEIRHATTLAAGFEELSREPVDVLLLDLGLPDSDGVDTVVRFRRQAPHLPLVVFTGSDAPQLAATTLDAGADGHLVKGALGALDLRRTLRRAIGRREAVRWDGDGARRGEADDERALPQALELRIPGAAPAETVELSSLVRRAESLLRAVVPEHIALRLLLSEELPPTSAKLEDLLWALLELVANAVEAIGDAAGTIEVRTGAGPVEPAAGGGLRVSGHFEWEPLVWLEVRDTGRGFDAMLLHQLGSSPEREALGRDYGDSQLERMLRDGEAGLFVDSRPGGGATFRILLPVRDS